MVLISCNDSKTEVDSIYFNGSITTLNDSLPKATCIIIKNKIISYYIIATLISHLMYDFSTSPFFIDAVYFYMI